MKQDERFKGEAIESELSSFEIPPIIITKTTKKELEVP